MLIEEDKMPSLLEIKEDKNKGYCSVYKKTARIIIADTKVVLDRSDDLCRHAMSTILHYSTIRSHDLLPIELDLTT